jgi:peptidyl-prolyl cis-trans isomerase SurA
MTAEFRHGKSLAAAALLLIALAAPVAAQTVVATVNDDPITNVDIEQHARILRVLRKPASPQAAFDDVVETRLKLIETSKFKIKPSPSEVGWAMGFPARELKTEPQQLLAAMTRAGVSQDQVEQKFKAEAAWMMYIRALNRTLEVSESDVRAEVARRGGKSMQYTIRQVIFVVPNGAGGGVVQERLRNAQALRARFNGCEAGAEIVRTLQDAVIQSAVTRSGSGLPAQLKQILDKTEVGHLTPPQRGAEGVVMLALCDKSNRDDNEATEAVRGDLLVKRLEGVSNQRFAEVKARAIIVKK